MTKEQRPDPDQLWQIHGKYYDLEFHPGGRRLLHQVRGTDCTAVFECTDCMTVFPKIFWKDTT
jgi:cytochrome b involved in lipid metabolism